MSKRQRLDIGDVNSLFRSSDSELLSDGEDELLNESYTRYEMLFDGEDNLFQVASNNLKQLCDIQSLRKKTYSRCDYKTFD